MGDARDWAAEGWLDGLDPAAAAERAALLDDLVARGFGEAELRRGHADGLLPFLPAERVVMGGPPTLTLSGLAEAAGVDVELLVATRRAQGLPVPGPDVPEYAGTEVTRARAIATFSELGLRDEQVLAVSRILGRGMAQAAQVMRATAVELVLEPGMTERELAARYAATVEVVLPHLGPLLDGLMRAHLRNMVRSETLDGAALEAGRLPGSRTVSVAFADLVGFTRLGVEVAPEEVGRVAERLAVLAAEVADGPVRMVKTIGDAAMLVSDDAAALVRAGLRLAEVVDAEPEDFPQVRVGIAHGAANPLGGDWYGAPVNLASRVTALARAGTVLVEAEAREAAREATALRFSFAGERRVKGVPGAVKLWRARPADPDA